MTAPSAQAAHIPRLGKLWLWTLIVALVSHLAAAAYIFAIQPTASSGGGGKIIGTMSIALGGAPGAQPEPAETKETVAEEVEAPATKPLNTDSIAPAPAKPKPQEKPPKPRTLSRLPTAATPKVDNRPDAAPRDQTTLPDTRSPDAAPATMASNATPTLGEGPAATTPGIGGSIDTKTQSYDAYLALVRARIEAERTYPASARRSGHEGTTSIQLTIGSNGSLTSARVTRSSGHFALDRAAKRMVQKAAPFPAPPQTTFQVTVPIAFALR
ncbi:energy transducer TonB [Pyruvatibacter sp.]|uniref:energy transducer TonB n=1 Tax=Pyruvatibacter sp. TaxID=1981328 RepID=UPI003263676B